MADWALEHGLPTILLVSGVAGLVAVAKWAASKLAEPWMRANIQAIKDREKRLGEISKSMAEQKALLAQLVEDQRSGLAKMEGRYLSELQSDGRQIECMDALHQRLSDTNDRIDKWLDRWEALLSENP